MKGSLVHRGPKRWSIALDLPPVVKSQFVAFGIVTKKMKRRQKWIAFHGTEKQAEIKLNDLVGKAQKNQFVESSKITLGEWLDQWLEKSVKPPCCATRTYKSYKTICKTRIKPALGSLPLQAVQVNDLVRYYADQKDLKDSTKQLHHAILSTSLQSAVANHLLYRNPAKDIERKQKPRAAIRTGEELTAQSWTRDDARKFLTVAKKQSPQLAAFYVVTIDTGMRKSEVFGLRWVDINLDTATLRVVQQLVHTGVTRHGVTDPVFGPTKTKKSRVIDLGDEAVRLLREHKKNQAELKMRNRASYWDGGLVFAREHADTHGPAPLGYPLAPNVVADATFHKLSAEAGVPRITFHALRHTTASLLLEDGEQVKVVSERLGHSKVSITMDTYAHVMPGQQKQAASRLNALLHGR